VVVRAGVAERPVFSIDAETFTWGDVVTAAQIGGSWHELERHTREALSCRRRQLAERGQLERTEVVEATTRFRYERNLLAGEQLEEWLRRWDLTTAEWRESIERALLLEHWADKLQETVKAYPVAEEQIDAAIWPDAVCTGLLERTAQDLAGTAALAAAAGKPLWRGEEALAGLAAAAERVRAAAATDDAIEREIAAHRLEWLRVEGEVLDLSSEEVAREAALCILLDGQTVSEVAAAIGVEPHLLHAHIADVEGELASVLLAAREGELAGPLARDGVFKLILVQRKVPPDASDREVRERAARKLAERTVERAVRDRVEWHDAF
jgi:hypothetical protein